MKVGDLVKHFLTEQIGVILSIRDDCDMVRILWTTQACVRRVYRFSVPAIKNGAARNRWIS